MLYFGLINTSKAVHVEMLEARRPRNTFRLYFAPGRENSIVRTDSEMLAFTGDFTGGDSTIGGQDAEIRGINDQVGKLLRIWNG